MNELSLFSGGGGGLLATKHLLGWSAVGYVERDEYCRQIIQARMCDGLLDDVTVRDDVRTFDGKLCRGSVDVVSGGFPCQPFSVAGKQLGEDDPRNCWPDTIRIIREIRPEWCFLENVPALRCARRKKGDPAATRASYFGRILGDLAASGFNAEWCVLSAAECGAPHLRKRLWLVAHAASSGCEPEGGRLREGDAAGSGRRRLTDGCTEENASLGNEAGRLMFPTPAARDWKSSHPRETTMAENSRPLNEVVSHGGGRQLNPAWVALLMGWPKNWTKLDPMDMAEFGEWLAGFRDGDPASRYGRRAWCDGRWEVGTPRVNHRNRFIHRTERLRAIGNGQVPIVAATAFRLLQRRLLGNLTMEAI